MDTPELILVAHAVIAALFFGFAALGLANGSPGAAGTRAMLGLLVVGLGYSLYRVRKRQQETA